MERKQYKNVLITGGTAGIGRATALLLTSQGHQVMIVGRDSSKLSDILSSYDNTAKNGKLEGIIADLTKADDIKNVLSEFDKLFGSIDVLINNAGIGHNGVMEGSASDLSYLVMTNLWSYMELSGSVAKKMIANNTEGQIINIGSMSADTKDKDSSAYVATKSGIQGFTEAFRKEVNPHNIRVSLIEPGSVGTDMQPTTSEEEIELCDKMEMLAAEDIATCVQFILSQPKRLDIVNMKVKPLRQFI
jgi:NADP-dependent 3-hydroxy acid dehydrogenase YdfG